MLKQSINLYLSIYPSIYLSIYLSTCLPIYLSNLVYLTTLIRILSFGYYTVTSPVLAPDFVVVCISIAGPVGVADAPADVTGFSSHGFRVHYATMLCNYFSELRSSLGLLIFKF